MEKDKISKERQRTETEEITCKQECKEDECKRSMSSKTEKNLQVTEIL